MVGWWDGREHEDNIYSDVCSVYFHPSLSHVIAPGHPCAAFPGSEIGSVLAIRDLTRCIVRDLNWRQRFPIIHSPMFDAKLAIHTGTTSRM